MAVRAKFYVRDVTKHASGGTTVVFYPVCRGEDNKEWSKWTPSGELKMAILNDEAAAQFEPGEEFFLDFTPAPKGKEGMTPAE